MKREQLFFGMSVAMPIEEAIAFKKSLGSNERYYLLRVRERPGDKHRSRREGYVVVRYPHTHKGEVVPRGNTVWGERGKLM